MPHDASAPRGDPLPLPADPASAARARRFVTAVLADLGHEELTDTARTAVSELVANAVLHAHSDLEVAVTVAPGAVRVGVRDGSRLHPTLRHYGRLAATGRGLALVAALAHDVGVDVTADGKTIWFELATDAATAHPHGVGEQPTGGSGLPQAAAEAGTGDIPRDAVVLSGMPHRLWRAAQSHHDDMLRELALQRYVEGTPATADPTLVAAEQAQALLASAVARRAEPPQAELPPAELPPAELPQVDDSAVDPAPLTGPIEVVLSPGQTSASAFQALQEVLDEAEDLSRQGRLLALPASPVLVGLRMWCCQEVVGQLEGREPHPWGRDHLQHP